jgi:hypothetical protein
MMSDESDLFFGLRIYLSISDTIAVFLLIWLKLIFSRSLLAGNNATGHETSESDWSYLPDGEGLPPSLNARAGKSGDNDYDVLAEGVVVGRIFKANASPLVDAGFRSS